MSAVAASSSAGDRVNGLASPRPVFAVAAVLLGSFLVGFDPRLFSTALPDLRGAFGLSFDQGAWLNTYTSAPQIFLAPAIAWLAATFGVRRVLFWPSMVYAVLSLIIPEVRNWELLVALHILRGLLLGVFIPATIMIIFRNLPMKWWIPAIGVYAFRLAFSQSVGVALVGFYEDYLSWQWVYWQDVIIAPLIALLVALGAPREKIDVQLLQSADWGGMALLGTSWLLIYAALDQGNRLDWLESGLILTLLCGGIVLHIGFFINELIVKAPWASHEVLASRNVLLGFAAILCFDAASISNSMLVPGFLTGIIGLRPEQYGWPLILGVTLPLMLVMPLASRMLRLCDARIPMLLGFIAFAIAAQMATAVTHEWSPWTFIPILLIQAVGQGFTFFAVVIFILSNADPKRSTAIAAYVQVMRLGGAELAVTFMATFLRHREQLHSYLLGLHVPFSSEEVAHAIQAYAAPFAAAGGSAQVASERGVVSLAGLVSREANILAYIDGFKVSFWGALAGILVVALLAPSPRGPLTPQH